MTFDTYYPSNPWSGISTNQRAWYVPFLRKVYYREAIYSRFVTSQFALAGPGSPVTTSMTITSLIPPHGNVDPIGLRDLWMASSYMDSFARTVNFTRYGGKMGLHKYDDLITYWKKDRIGGLKRIINGGLGQMMTEVMDNLARNAFLSNTYAMYGASGADFSDIDSWSADKISTELIDDIRLGMAERGVPFTVQPRTNFLNAKPICITTPGVIRDMINEASGTGAQNEFIDVMRYADAGRIIRGEVGVYRGVRFVETPRGILYNCGPITVQPTIAASVSAGDGAPSTVVDGVKTVGQQSGVTNYITVSDATGIAVNDIVTVHVDRTSANGVTNGVDYTDGKLHNRRVVKIDGNNISFDYPILEDFSTDLGGSVYGYVTKGRHIHTALFLGGMDGVVMGIGEAPQIHMPRPVDDFDSMYRITWDGYFKYQLFEPEVFEVAFLAGSNRIKGSRVI